MNDKVTVKQIFNRGNNRYILVLTSDRNVEMYSEDWLVNERNRPICIVKGIVIHNKNLPKEGVLLMNMQFETHCVVMLLKDEKISEGDTLWISKGNVHYGTK